VSRNKYEVINYDQYKFFFKYEDDPPDMLHIYDPEQLKILIISCFKRTY
jgi:hypothetical protein